MHQWTNSRRPRRERVDEGYEQPPHAWATCCGCGELVRVTRDQARRYGRHDVCMLCVMCRLLPPGDEPPHTA